MIINTIEMYVYLLELLCIDSENFLFILNNTCFVEQKHMFVLF